MNKRLGYRIFYLLCLIFNLSLLNAQHLKKDGTPDRRYKENHTSSLFTPVYNSDAHLKKDGTPDKRYAENKDSKPSNTYYFPKENSGSYSDGIERDGKGRIKRNSSAKREFMKESGYPEGRPGYVVDHIKPLKKGGCDCPENMQWQTKEEAKEKDKWE